MSTIQSALAIVSSSCSTTSTVLPRSRRRSSVSIEPAVVALVQADRRLVEHVQRADQPGADLAGQADALRLATGERAGRARQREVVEADVEQEAEPGVDLLRDPLGDHPVALGELERREELGRLADRHVAHLGDVEVVDRDGERRRLQSGAAARRARHLAHVALVLLAPPVALRTRCGGA